MIKYDGYEELIEKVYKYNQEHIFKYWDRLENQEKERLFHELEDVDFDLLKKLYSGSENSESMDYKEAPYIALPKNEKEQKKYFEAEKTGIEHIKQGRTAAFIVAGGQGSRLGFNGPKGKYPVGPVSGDTLFQLHGKKIFKYEQKYEVEIPWLIMTSKLNHNETVEYFEENRYFGLGRNNVYIFPQNMIASLDKKGKLILSGKCGIFKNPDGHGGSLTALATSRALEMLAERGIETISYFQVDNPLVKIIDPVFIGFHIMDKADISSKAVRKTEPGEKVGVFVEFTNGKMGVIEYSDMPEEKKNEKNESGGLRYSSGSIAIHLFNREFIETLTSGKDISLPFHAARKKIKAFINSGFLEIDGYKFEKFVFDALQLTDKNIIFETSRKVEFAPVKNARGVDSIESAHKLMSNLHRVWLEEKGIEVGDNAVIEISPEFAVGPEDLEPSISVPNSEKIYLE